MRAENILGVCWEVGRKLAFVDSFLLSDSQELGSESLSSKKY